MTPLSWLYMLVVWAAILTLNIFCFSRIFRKPKDQRAWQEEQIDVEKAGTTKWRK